MSIDGLLMAFRFLVDVPLEILVVNIRNQLQVYQKWQRISASKSGFVLQERLHTLPPHAIIEQYLCPNSYRVSKEALIRYGNSKYSVDSKLINKKVTVDTLENNL